ncbi:MAG: T9SS type A sorting domain-containing protein [Chitinophagaceae bacterium]|nr:MAG: T9SS type A sorting domain-containing protein [Chitinophagaceae bacterium]
MKTTSTLLAFLITLTSVTASAQTTYNVTQSSKFSTTNIPDQCVNCVINLASGITLTMDKDVAFQNVSINGGSAKSTIDMKNGSFTFWSAGSFNNIIGTFKNSKFVNSGTVTFNNSNFTFTGSSTITVYTSINLNSSTWKLYDNTDLTSTGGTLVIKSGSITVGDGTPSSKATATFNGGNLSLLDATSFFTLSTNKNTYFNWSNYNGNGKSISTLINNNPTLSGPATLSGAGVANSATLPVKLVSFAAKTSNNAVMLNWITSEEINAEVFEIEKSVDGLHWSKVGEVAAKGNTSSTSKYSYTDDVKNGSSFAYRLKMVDLDAKFEYSPIVKVTLNGSVAASIKTYPNPATDFFAVDGLSAGSQIQVISMSGSVVKLVNGYVSNAKVSLSGVVAGNYVVKVISANGASQAHRIIVAK